MATVEAAVSTPKDASGTYISVQAGTPRLAQLPDLAAGSQETASAPPPVFAEPPDLPTQASGDDQAAFKLAWQAKMSPTGNPGPGPADSSVPGDGLPGFSALRPRRP